MTNYSSELFINSSLYRRLVGISPPSYYFEAIRINASTSGRYGMVSSSRFDSYGYLYNQTFNASKPLDQLMIENDNSYGNQQFLITASLDANSTYILIFTTSLPLMTGLFSITSFGSGLLGFDRVNVPSAISKQRSSQETVLHFILFL